MKCKMARHLSLSHTEAEMNMFLREVAKFHFVFTSQKKKYFLEANEPCLTNPPRTQHKVKMQIYERNVCEVYMTCAEANKNAKTPNTTKQEKNVMVMWSLRATSCSLQGHFMVNRVQNLFTKSTWRSAKWISSTAELERGVWEVDKIFLGQTSRWIFGIFKNFHGGPEVTRCYAEVATNWFRLIGKPGRSSAILTSTGFWPLRVKTYSRRPLCETGFKMT